MPGEGQSAVLLVEGSDLQLTERALQASEHLQGYKNPTTSSSFNARKDVRESRVAAGMREAQRQQQH